MNLRELPQLMLDVFRGRQNHIAYQNGEAFAPHACPGGIDPSWIADNHLAGVQCYGFYVLDEQSRCWCSCVDFDNKPEHPDPAWRSKTERVYWELVNAGLDPLVEVSQSNSGSHVWLFFAEPVDAWLVRAWWRKLGEKLEIRFREIFPKQDHLREGGLGNLVRYPLWNESRFVDVEDEWNALDPVEALKKRQRCTAADLRLLAWQLKLGELAAPVALASAGEVTSGAEGLSPRVRRLIDRPWTLLGRRWLGDARGMTDASPSAIAMSVATELVRLYVPTPEIEAAVRYWLRVNDRGDKADRDRWIATTVAKAYDFVVQRVEERSADTSAMTLHDCVNRFLATLESGGVRYIGSGVDELDQSVDGVAPGEVAVVAARPSHGKSAFAFQWLDHAAAQGVRGLIISEEMSGDEIGKRRLQSIASIDFDQWHRGVAPQLREETQQHFSGREPVYVVENCGTIDRVEEVIDQFCAIYGTGLVAVDYLQLLGGRGDRYEVVTEASRRIKQCAQRNGCAVLLLSQMNRGVEGRPDATPKMSDLRESGQIEQDADLIMFLEWPFRTDAKKNRDIPHKYIITVKKRRNGPIRQIHEHAPAGIVVTEFDPMSQRIGTRRRLAPPPPLEATA